jgi:hypothetical protein
MTGHLKNILTLLVSALLAAVLLGTLIIWTMDLAPRFKTRMARKAALAPRIKEAKELGLTYEAVLAAPYKTVGKPVLWCLRKGDSDRSYYNGEETKLLHVTNSGRMLQGGSHQSCAETLLTITTVTAVSFGGVSSVRMEAYFEDYP